MATTTVRDYKTVSSIKNALDESFAAGVLTSTQLIAAINTIDSAGYETIPCSVGFGWLFDKLHPFRAKPGEIEANIASLQSCDLDFEAVFRTCLDNSYVTSVISSETLFGFIDEPKRISFLADVLARHMPESNDWVKASLTVGIPRAYIAESILDKLRKSKVHRGSSTPTFLEYYFLKYGSGRVEYRGLEWRLTEKNTMWSVLTDDEFVSAMRIVIDKAPELLFEWRTGLHQQDAAFFEKVEARLGSEMLSVLLTEATVRLTSIDGVSIEAASRLPLQLRQKLVTTFKGGRNLALLLHVAASMPEGGLDFFKKFIAPISVYSYDLASQFIRLQPQLKALVDSTEQRHKELAAYADRILVVNLGMRGVIVGTMQEEPYRYGTQPCIVIKVKGRPTRYIESRDQWSAEHFFPKKGDRVLFTPERGTVLTPTVISVVFKLVSRAEK